MSMDKESRIEIQSEKYEVMGGLLWEGVTEPTVASVLEPLIG